MVGPNPIQDGKIVPIRAQAARHVAGIHDTEALLYKLRALAINQTGRLSVPQHNPDILPKIADILHGLASDITGIHNQVFDAEVRCIKLSSRVREAEQRLRDLNG